MNVLRVENPGVCASVQDSGRRQFQKFGVAVGGAMDLDSHDLANLLVGNNADAATVEIAWFGTAISLDEDAAVAIVGADLRPTTSGHLMPMNRPVWLPRRQTICFQHARRGCYAYLAVAGGIITPQILGSRSTHFRSRIGGLRGTSLQAGDRLPVGDLNPLNRAILKCIGRTSVADESSGESRTAKHPSATRWYVANPSVVDTSQSHRIKSLRGRHFGQLDAMSQRRFWEAEFTVSHISDRMGYRLDGPELRYQSDLEFDPAGVSRGTLQLPPGGNPIVLMADAAPTGGYPNVAHVTSVDLGRLAQVQPGQSVQFEEIDLSTAQRLLAERNAWFQRLSRGIRIRVFG